MSGIVCARRRTVLIGGDGEGMTDKELRRLSRMELIDIIFELQQRYEESLAESQRLKEALDERVLHMEQAGSLAEAALRINGVFEAAQAAADQYVQSLKASNEEIEKTLSDARAEGGRIIQAAQDRARQLEASDEQEKPDGLPEEPERAQEELEITQKEPEIAQAE